MSAVPAPKYVSIEEYLVLEEDSEVKHEYYQGEIFAMAGGTIAHNQVIRNTMTAIDNFLREKNCQVFPSDLKIHIEANTLFTYPDLSIACGQLERWNGRNDTITNPVVIIEILSKKTQNYDRGNKFKLYRSIPALKEYILVSSSEVLVEHYSKQDTGYWTLKETANAEDTFRIEAIDFSCPVNNLYRNVSFEEN